MIFACELGSSHKERTLVRSQEDFAEPAVTTFVYRTHHQRHRRGVFFVCLCIASGNVLPVSEACSTIQCVVRTVAICRTTQSGFGPFCYANKKGGSNCMKGV